MSESQEKKEEPEKMVLQEKKLITGQVINKKQKFIIKLEEQKDDCK